MPIMTAVRGDITTCRVDAIVNAANSAMRGGGGVDGAIHRAGGPAVLADCVARFPRGLATGDAGWTTAGDLPARWVIHTVGPNYTAGQRDRGLLESCYRRCLEVADSLGVRSIAFPLVSAGVYGWPRGDAIAVAVDTIAAARTSVAEVTLVAFDRDIHAEIEAALARPTPLRILQGVQVLHGRGYHGVRVSPGLSPSGMHWRVTVGPAGSGERIAYSTGGGTEFAGARVSAGTSPEEVAEVILAALPGLAADRGDPAYVRWYADLMALVEEHGLPVSFADFDLPPDGWTIGGGGVRHPHPPPAAGIHN